MRVLLVGGSGYVGSLLLPYLAEHHTIRVLDRRSPRSPAPRAVEQVIGDATDLAALRAAMCDVDALVHCAMAGEEVSGSFDVNVKSVHLSLLAAHEAGVPHAVHISSLSVYRDLLGRTLDGSEPPDATDLYGLTKRLGEQVCQAAVAEWGLSVTSLRLTWPTADADWPDWTRHGTPRRLFTTDGVPVEPTAASDLAAAVLAALDHRDGYQIFTISGDRSARRWSIARAERMLGWRPEFTPTR
jgi:nucleoside-diphosphate-sugar epimerase